MVLALAPPPDDVSIHTALSDPRRLAAVQRTGLLDSAPEQSGAATPKAEERKAPSEPPKHPNPNPPAEGPDDDLPF